MKNVKKGLAFLLSILLLTAVLPVPATVFAEPAAMSGTCGDGVTWRLEEDPDYTGWYDDTTGMLTAAPADENDPEPGIRYETHYKLYIEGSGAMDDYDEGAGNPVGWEDARWDISQVEVSEGVTHIGAEAFRHCDNLRRVELPYGLESIGAFAFEGCMRGVGEDDEWVPVSGLDGITLPDTLTYIGPRAFADNEFFAGPMFFGSIEDVCLAGEEYAENWRPSDRVREVFDNTYFFHKWFESNYLYGTCGEGLSWKLTKNDDTGWYDEETGERVEEPEDPEASGVRYETFYTLSVYGDGEMDNYRYEEDDCFPQPWEEMRWNISRVDVGEGVTHIGDNAFCCCDNLRSVFLPDTLESIGAFAFENCVRGVGDGDDWRPVSGLFDVTIPANVTYIAGQAFANNDFLNDVFFEGELSAEDICLAGEEEVADWSDARRVQEVFDNTPWYDVWFLENAMRGACGESVSWELSENEDSFWQDDETGDRVDAPADPDHPDPGTHYEPLYTLIIKGEGAMDDYYYEEDSFVPQPWEYLSYAITCVDVGEGVTTVGASAFRWLSGLRRVILPASLEAINEHAFENCCFGWDFGDGWVPMDGLHEVAIPENVTYIGSRAFGDNPFLDTVDFNVDPEEVCLAGEEYVEWRSPVDRVREAFDNTPWFRQWFEDNYMSGTCGEGLTWALTENEDSGWYYEETGERVENPEDEDTPGTWYQTYYTLSIAGEGAMDDFRDEETDEVEQPWDYVSPDITRLEIAEGVTTVGDSAFRWLHRLRSVSLPATLERIGAFAFENCCDGRDEGEGWYAVDGLSEITIPAGVTYIGSQAFANNRRLETVNFESDLADVCLAGEENAEDWRPAERIWEVFDSTPWFDNWFEENCMSGTCGEGLTWALTENEDSGWYYDETGERVENEEDFDQFYTHYETYYTLSIVGEGAMDDFRDEETDRVERPWEFIPGEITRLEVAEGVTTIGDSALRWTRRLRSVSLPETLETIGAFAFESCCDGRDEGDGWYAVDGLSQITIPAGVTYIGSQAFANNGMLETVNFESDLADVCLAGGEEFADWSVSERVRGVFDNTPWFDDWFRTNCMSGSCGENVTWRVEENEDAGWYYNETNERVADEEDFDQPYTHYETYYTLFIAGEGAMKDYAVGEEFFESVPWEDMRWQITRLDVAEGVTHIGDNAFRWHDNLRVVSLPATLESIGTFAFESCKRGEGDGDDWHVVSGLEEVTIPDNVTYIAGMAFANNEMLTTVNFNGDIDIICLAGEEEAENWSAARRVQEVFDNTPWFDTWFADNCMDGDCGENLTWRLEKNDEDSFWVYNDTWEVVTNAEDEGKGNTHEEVRYTLYIEGEGAMDDYGFNGEDFVSPPWDFSSYGITRVDVAEGVTHIGDNAFRWHDNLRVVSLPATLESIGSYAFESCKSGRDDGEGWYAVSGLAEITIPDNVSYIAGQAFANNDFLETVNFAGDIAKICLAGEEEAADWSEVQRVRAVFDNTPWFENWHTENYLSGDCGENVTWRMEVNEERTGWYYEETDERVEDPADFDAPGTYHKTLYTILIDGDGVMDDYDYDDEFGLRPPWEDERWSICRVEVSEGVTHIGSHAFRWCDNLREISLPESLESIGAFAFESCKFGRGMDEDWYPVAGLSEVTIPAGVELIGRQAFGHNDFLTFVNFDGDFVSVCMADDEEAQGWFEGDRIREVFDGSPWFDDWFEQNYMNGFCGDNATWTLTETGEGIWVWYNGDPVEDSEQYGDDGMFYANYYRLTISGEGDLWDNIVEGHPGLSYFSINVTELVVEDGITSVGAADFRNLDNLVLVTLPTTLSSIGENAFENCPRLGDGDVYYDYPGDIDEWNAVTIAEGNDPLLAAALHVHEHTPAEAVTEHYVAPTCTEPGSYDTVVYCEDCGKELSRTPGAEEKLGHDWGAWTKLNDTQHSRVCGNDASHVEKANHTWNAGVVTKAATCTAAGVKTYTCTVCAATKTETINATGHNYGAWTKLNDTQHQRVCANDANHVEKENHTWNAGVITKAATCTAAGVKTYTCTVCSATKTETINAIDHSWGAWTKLNDTQHQRVCANDANHVEKENHTWNAGVITKAATCKEAGVKTYTCTVCGATKTEDIAKTTAHTWNAGVITKDATCKEAGVKTYTCTVCGTTKTEAIAKTTTHTWNAGVVTKAATCKEAGVKTYTCTVCGATKTEAIAKTTAHTWDGGKVTKEATETAAGVKTYTCTVCGATRTEPIPQLPTEVKDDASGITVTYDPGTYTQKITVKVVETAPPAEALPADYEKTYSVDISTYIGDREVEPNAPVTVAVPVPEGFNANTLAVYHIKDDGTVEKVAFTVKDGMIVFTATGFSVYVVADTSTEIQTPAYTCGDVDGNGKIEAADARLALRQAVGLETYAPGSREFLACDADGDGSVKAADARLILRAAVGLESLDKKQGGTAA